MVITNKNGSSDWLETHLGIKQGFVMGPLHFCLYVNDLQDILDGNTYKHIFYADDLQIYVHTSKDKILEGVARLTDVAQMVSGWSEGSGLRLNAGKTKAIVFGSEYNVNAINALGLPCIRMQSGKLRPFSGEVASLGVILDSKLTWQPHIDHVAKEVNKALYNLRFI